MSALNLQQLRRDPPPFALAFARPPLLCSSSTHPLSPSQLIQAGTARPWSPSPFPRAPRCSRHRRRVPPRWHLYRHTTLHLDERIFLFFFLFLHTLETFFPIFSFLLEIPQSACNPCSVRLLEGPGQQLPILPGRLVSFFAAPKLGSMRRRAGGEKKAGSAVRDQGSIETGLPPYHATRRPAGMAGG
jgi:hypothetical protein